MRRARHMTRRAFYNEIKPYLKKNDRSYNRELYNDWLDHHQRNDDITEKQANKWTHPKSNYFYSKEDREARK